MEWDMSLEEVEDNVVVVDVSSDTEIPPVQVDVDSHPPHIQEDIGSVADQGGLGNSYIFVQGWSSWIFAVDSMGLKGISTCVEWNLGTARKEFKATLLGHTLRTLWEVRVELEEERVPKSTTFDFYSGLP